MKKTFINKTVLSLANLEGTVLIRVKGRNKKNNRNIKTDFDELLNARSIIFLIYTKWSKN